MESFSYGRTSQQFRFLRRRQFLPKGKLPFTNVLTVDTMVPHHPGHSVHQSVSEEFQWMCHLWNSGED
ncbi:MAG: hypothetical protein KDB01_11740 [Planctomycetaceae bacterium]|nr:hypothetical protein [Planctomycetaceae bacterium]